MGSRRRLALLVLFLLVLAGAAIARIAMRPAYGLADYPLAECTELPGPGKPGRIFHVDPQGGSADGDGSRERPWNDLQAVVDNGLIGERERYLTVPDRLIAALIHRPAVTRSAPREEAVVRGGDVIRLASGDYGAIDLSGLANADFVTIEASPGARPRFTGLTAAGASHFILRGIVISGADPIDGGRYLLTTREASPRRADNLVFEDIDISWRTPAFATDPADFAAHAPDGANVSGDCLTFRGNTVHNVESAIRVYMSRHVRVADNEVFHISVDGVQFSGEDIAIQDNLIRDQIATPDKLHPDCMQGQAPPGEWSRRIVIEGNTCIARTKSMPQRPTAWRGSGRFGWMGINIFNTRWDGVSVRCNLVIPLAQHGIAMYGVDRAVIAHNTVAGFPKGKFSWIAVMRSLDGRHPVANRIEDNRATAYLNAVHASALPVAEMVERIKVNKRDRVINKALERPVKGVQLRGNTWLIDPARDLDLPADLPFAVEEIDSSPAIADAADALSRFPLPTACSRD